jgi:hypothetical protein
MKLFSFLTKAFSLWGIEQAFFVRRRRVRPDEWARLSELRAFAAGEGRPAEMFVQ